MNYFVKIHLNYRNNPLKVIQLTIRDAETSKEAREKAIDLIRQWENLKNYNILKITTNDFLLKRHTVVFEIITREGTLELKRHVMAESNGEAWRIVKNTFLSDPKIRGIKYIYSGTDNIIDIPKFKGSTYPIADIAKFK